MKGIWIRYFVDIKNPCLDYREFRDINELISWWRCQQKLGKGTVIVDIGNEEDLP